MTTPNFTEHIRSLGTENLAEQPEAKFYFLKQGRRTYTKDPKKYKSIKVPKILHLQFVPGHSGTSRSAGAREEML